MGCILQKDNSVESTDVYVHVLDRLYVSELWGKTVQPKNEFVKMLIYDTKSSPYCHLLNPLHILL